MSFFIYHNFTRIRYNCNQNWQLMLKIHIVILFFYFSGNPTISHTLRTTRFPGALPPAAAARGGSSRWGGTRATITNGPFPAWKTWALCTTATTTTTPPPPPPPTYYYRTSQSKFSWKLSVLQAEKT